MEHTSNSNLTKEERRIELEQISRGKNGMLEIHRLHHLASGDRAGAIPVVRANDSHERLIHEILRHEFPQSQVE